MSQANDICYVVEKTWDLHDVITVDHRKFVFDTTRMHDAFVLKCNVSHKNYVKMLLGKDTYKPITDVVCIDSETIANWCGWIAPVQVQYCSYEEFMLDLNINMQIVPCIEYYLVRTPAGIRHRAKIVDYESGEVLWQVEPTSLSCLGWQA